MYIIINVIINIILFLLFTFYKSHERTKFTNIDPSTDSIDIINKPNLSSEVHTAILNDRAYIDIIKYVDTMTIIGNMELLAHLPRYL